MKCLGLALVLVTIPCAAAAELKIDAEWTVT